MFPYERLGDRPAGIERQFRVGRMAFRTSAVLKDTEKLLIPGKFCRRSDVHSPVYDSQDGYHHHNGKQNFGTFLHCLIYFKLLFTITLRLGISV